MWLIFIIYLCPLCACLTFESFAYQLSGRFRYANLESAYRRGKSQALDALHVCRDLLIQCAHGDGVRGSGDSGPTSPQAVAKIYGRASTVLRDKREAGLLQQAMNELGDLQFAFYGNRSGGGGNGSGNGGSGGTGRSLCDAAWRGSIDALFGTVDAEDGFEERYASILAAAAASSPDAGAAAAAFASSLEASAHGKGRSLASALEFSSALPAALAASKGLAPCLLAATTLGKLGRTCCAMSGRARRLRLARMALPLWRAPLSLSLAHPARLCDYAAYVPTPASLFLGADPFSNPLRLSLVSCLTSLEHCARALVAGGEALLALPLLAMLEGLQVHLARSPRPALRARLLRVDALSACGLLGPAASALASVLSGAHLGRVPGGYAGLCPASRRSGEVVGRPKAPPAKKNRAKSPYPWPLDDDAAAAAAAAAGGGGGGGGEALALTAASLLGEAPPVDFERPPKALAAAGNDEEGHGGRDGEVDEAASTAAAAAAAALEKDPDHGEDPSTRAGLPFYGRAPFYAHLPPDHPANAPALAWLCCTAAGEDGLAPPAPEAEALDPKAAKAAEKAKKPDPAAEAAAKAAAEARAHAAATGPSTAPAGAGDAAASVRASLGGSGLRQLALARGRLLLALSGPEAGLGAGAPGGGARAKLRAAAEAMGRGVAEQCLQRAFVAHRLASVPNHFGQQAEAAAEAALSSAPAPTPEGGAAGGASGDPFGALESVVMRPGLLRALMDAQLLRARCALADARMADARVLAAAACAAVRHQASAAGKAEQLAQRAEADAARGLGWEATTAFRAGSSGEEAEETKASRPASPVAGVAGAAAAGVATSATSAAVRAVLVAEADDDGNWDAHEDGDEGGAPFGCERWLELREVLAGCALAQGRDQACLAIANDGVASAAGRHEQRLGRRLALLGAAALARGGSLAAAEARADLVVGDMARDPLKGGAVDFAKACAFAAGLRRDRAIGARSPNEAAQLLSEASGLLEAGSTALAAKARQGGFLGVGTLTVMGSPAFEDARVFEQGRPPRREPGGGGGGPHASAEALALAHGSVAPGAPLADGNLMLADLRPPLLAALLEAAVVAEAAERGPEHALRAPLHPAASGLVDADPRGGGGGILALGGGGGGGGGGAVTASSLASPTAPTPLANLYQPEVRLLAGLLAGRAAIALDAPPPPLAPQATLGGAAAQQSAQSAASAPGVASAANEGAVAGGASAAGMAHYGAALRFATEALALQRHVAAPSAHGRARLLLTVGCLRRRTLALTAAETSWRPHQTTQDADTAAAWPSGPAFFCGAPRSHPVGACAGALLGSLRLSLGVGGHEHGLMREACLELVVLLGGGPMKNVKGPHLNMAMHFLVLAADLAAKQRSLAEELLGAVGDGTPLLPAADTDAGEKDKNKAAASAAPAAAAAASSALPPALAAELAAGLAPGSQVTTRQGASVLLSLLREEGADPFGLSPVARPLVTSLHAALAATCPPYAATCVLAADDPRVVSGPAAGAPAGLEQGLFCLQWKPCDPALDLEAKGEYLRDLCDGFLLLGQSASLPHFARSRRLATLGPVRANDVRAVRKRVASFRHALHRAEADGVVELPPVLLKGWVALLCAVHGLLVPGSGNSSVAAGKELRFSDGSDASDGLGCTEGTLSFLEAALDTKKGGASATSPGLCAWLRDALDPVVGRPPPPEEGEAEEGDEVNEERVGKEAAEGGGGDAEAGDE